MTNEKLIDTGAFAELMRDRVINVDTREVLIGRLAGSDQEIDLTEPVNCNGLGRIRHFRRFAGGGWPANPLPIDPARHALALPSVDLIRAQVFQVAACAWRCWYCYVPFNLLNGDSTRGKWVTARELVALYAEEPDRAPVIDLSGGSPDLAPEWVLWMMDALEEAKLSDRTYLWSDDNLSTDYVFSRLNGNERERLVAYKNYGRVCCFKGFDADSFAFNTGADAAGFEAQFAIFREYLKLGLDLYGYVTLTGADVDVVSGRIPEFVDRLRAIDEALPLRVVPLKIENFTPTREREARRSDARFAVAADVQTAAIEGWQRELERHYSSRERALPISEIPLGARR